MMTKWQSLALLLSVAAASGDVSSSANYTLATETDATSGGHRSTSANYRVDSTTGQDLGELASSANYTLKTSIIGQLTDPTALEIDSPSPSVNEGSSRQLAANAVMDDGTLTRLAPTDVAWSVAGGPLAGIDAGGLASAAAVYQNTTATAHAAYLGLADDHDLTVVNSDPDNFQSYAADQIDDLWQVTHFGAPPNSLAAPSANPDGDSASNLVEYLTGYDPNDRADFFDFELVGKVGDVLRLRLPRVAPGTRYGLERASHPNPPLETDWFEFDTITTATELVDFEIDDPDSDGERNFYRVTVEPE